MRSVTKLDMNLVEAEMQAKLARMRGAGLPLVYLEGELLIKEQVLEAAGPAKKLATRPRLEAAE